MIAGLRSAGLFAYLAPTLCQRAGSVRAMGILLVLMSFVRSMLIANDVPLPVICRKYRLVESLFMR